MPVFVEDPSQFSKARLKSDLIAHNVALPPAKSKKGVYVELHTRHVHQKNEADFSSDEEPDQGAEEEDPKDAEYLDPSHLTDAGLKAALLQYGMKPGPIVASTRAVYERKLRTLLLYNGHGKSNGTENGADEAVLYSDSENEEDSGEEIDDQGTEEPLTQAEVADQCQQDSEQETAQEPSQETFKDLVADKQVTPTGIYATRRRPIKGAAGRPVQYVYPDTPVSPTTFQRQEVERRMVSLKIQILVFVIVAIILYVVYLCVEDYSFNPFLGLLDILNQGLDRDEAEAQEVEDILELE